MTNFKIGDRVRIVVSVWDDSRDKDWEGWEGVIQEASPDPWSGIVGWYVFFPKARGKWRSFDIYEHEMELM